MRQHRPLDLRLDRDRLHRRREYRAARYRRGKSVEEDCGKYMSCWCILRVFHVERRMVE